MSRLSIDLTDEQHKALKAIAALDGKTMKQYAIDKLFRGKTDDQLADANQAWEEFKAFIGKRVDDALADPGAWRTFDDAWPEDGSSDTAA